MRLNVKDIIPVPGAVLPFQFELDLSREEFGGYCPICEPVQVTGEVRNSADVLVLNVVAETNLHLICDRCAVPFQRVKTVSFESLLASSLEDEENDEIILLENGYELDLDEIVTTAFILDMDTKNLCSEQCKGLCPSCGKNLNEGPCQCKPEVDPRLAVLAQLLDH